jgi:hypothetical protein
MRASPVAQISRTILRSHWATDKEVAVLATQTDPRPTRSGSWSAPLAGPSAEKEFFCARHGNIQQSAFLPEICVRPRHNAFVEARDNCRSYREPLREPTIVIVRTP